MIGKLKDIVREVFILLHIDITNNLKYDRLTRDILKFNLKSNFNCIDVGCHKGEILDMMLHYAPQGTHFGFEPIPPLFEDLQLKYKGKATIYPYALSDSSGETTFQYVKNAPAYSGIKKRHYDIKHPDIEEIKGMKRKLDEVISKEIPIHFIKIDVEGGEFGVLKGGKELLKANLPIVLFECGKGASEYYGTNPKDLHRFLTKEIGLNIYTLHSFLKKKEPISEVQFDDFFNTNKEYYFVAAKG